MGVKDGAKKVRSLGEDLVLESHSCKEPFS
jgi:hypothetical protein